MKFIDIHSHLIPSVDDGAEIMDITVSQVKNAVIQGATAFFATPHCYAFAEDPDAVYEQFDAMQEHLQKMFPNIGVYLGCEVMCSKEEMTAIVFALQTVFIPTMNNSLCVLAEFSQDADTETICYCMSYLRMWDFVPIIAHIERYNALVDRMDVIEKLRDMGCMMQLNVYSVEETEPECSRNWARKLILGKKIDFLGTDMHGYWVRMPSITQGMRWLEASCDYEYLEAIKWKNADEHLIRKARR